MKKISRLFFVAMIATFLVGTISSCKDDKKDDNNNTNYSDVIDNVAQNVIVETYKDLANKGKIVAEQADKFKANKNAATLSDLRQAWRTARQPWEQSEGFLFGPVDELGIDPAIDSWPVTVVDMDKLLNDITGVPVITEEIVDKQSDEAKGFHLIEYLIWGINGDKQVADFTDREIEYVVAACYNLKTKTAELYDAWRAGKGNWVENFTKAGNGSKKYTSQKGAIEDIVSGMITIADEVGTGKIEKPLKGNGGQAKPDEEESRFSHNSKLDFANNMKSISNVYYGKYNIDGKGISDIVAQFDPALDKQFQAELTACIQAIEAIPGTFTEAIVNNRTEVSDAQKKVIQVKTTLETKIKPLISEKL